MEYWPSDWLNKSCPKCASDVVDDVGTGNDVSQLREYFTIFTNEKLSITVDCSTLPDTSLPVERYRGALESVCFSVLSLCSVCVFAWAV